MESWNRGFPISPEPWVGVTLHVSSDWATAALFSGFQYSRMFLGAYLLITQVAVSVSHLLLHTGRGSPCLIRLWQL